MKKLFYSLYALFFNMSRVFPIKKNRIAFVAPHNGGTEDSLGILRSYIEKKGGFETVFISANDLKLDFSGFMPVVKSCLKAAGFFTFKAAALARSKYVFLNDNFMPMASLNFSKEAVVTQLWHAEGAFKKFGLSAPLTDDVREREKRCSARLDYVICTSESIAPIYAEAFGVDVKKVLSLGSPRNDLLFSNNNAENIRKEFDKAHPECAGKKLILYAPTFRDAPEKDSKLLESIDIEAFNREFPDCRLLTKLHPQINSAKPLDGATDVTKGHNIGDLTLICDTVITDYSSVCMDFALLSKPCIFYAFDLAEYEVERSFYFDYKSYVPGPVAEDFESLIDALKNRGDYNEKLKKFVDFNFDFTDGKNTERIFERIITDKT